MNRVIIEGYLGADPIVRYAKSGVAVANLSVATHEMRGDAQHTEWHRVVLFGKIAEAAQRFYRKGKQVLVEGRLQTRSWEDPKTGVTRYTTEILGSYSRLLGRRDEHPSAAPEDVDGAYVEALAAAAAPAPAAPAAAPAPAAPAAPAGRRLSAVKPPEEFDDEECPF